MSGKAPGGCGRSSANGCKASGRGAAGGRVRPWCGSGRCAPGKPRAASQTTSGRSRSRRRGCWGRRLASPGLTPGTPACGRSCRRRRWPRMPWDRGAGLCARARLAGSSANARPIGGKHAAAATPVSCGRRIEGMRTGSARYGGRCLGGGGDSAIASPWGAGPGAVIAAAGRLGSPLLSDPENSEESMTSDGARGRA